MKKKNGFDGKNEFPYILYVIFIFVNQMSLSGVRVCDFDFYDIFEEIEIKTCDANNELYDGERIFNPKFYGYKEIKKIELNKNDFAFSFYLGEEGQSVWGNVHSLHCNSPFKGITLFDPMKVFKRITNGESETIYIASQYLIVIKAFKVKSDSPLKFYSERDFRYLIKRFAVGLDFFKSEFVKPSCNEIYINDDGYYA